MANPDPKKKSHSLSDEAMAAAYHNEHHVSHDKKWAALPASDAPFVREAMVKAEILRESGVDPGDAYLQAIADLNHHRERQKLVETVSDLFDESGEPPEVDLDS